MCYLELIYLLLKIFFNLSDPTIFSSLLALYLDIPTAVKEAFLTGAPHFFALYLQKYFCDFGISLNSSGVGNTIGML